MVKTICQKNSILLTYKSTLALACAITLASCGKQLPPPPVIKPVIVNVPTPIACVKPSDIPDEPAKVALTGKQTDDLRIAAGQAVIYRAWGEVLQSLAVGCSRIP